MNLLNTINDLLFILNFLPKLVIAACMVYIVYIVRPHNIVTEFFNLKKEISKIEEGLIKISKFINEELMNKINEAVDNKAQLNIQAREHERTTLVKEILDRQFHLLLKELIIIEFEGLKNRYNDEKEINPNGQRDYDYLLSKLEEEIEKRDNFTIKKALDKEIDKYLIDNPKDELYVYSVKRTIEQIFYRIKNKKLIKR